MTLDILLAFIKCDDSSEPFQGEILDAQTSVTQAITALNATVNMSLPFNISDRISGPVTMVRNDLKFFFGNLSSLSTQIGSCDTIHNEYVTAVQSVCYTVMEGVGYLVLFTAVVGMSSALLVVCAARAWPHLKRRRGRGRCRGQDYTRVDDSDPFLPDPPPYERNYGSMRHSTVNNESPLNAEVIMVNNEDGPMMNLGPDSDSPPPAYQPAHYMQQYYSLAPTPNSVTQSTHTA
ncbi:protein tweety homolog 2-like [Babylonia areolata]|uniref:protein tweety homolog 2-like n=1 Tax=Babylonia areolata TaxID=304850 RepID=UPI003FD13C93